MTGHGAQMPAKRRALWIMIAISVSIVATTVLLSNDMKHLRSFMTWLGYPYAISSSSSISKVTTRKSRVLHIEVVRLPPRLVAPPTLSTASSFLRGWRLTGPQLCAALHSDGIDVSEWGASQLGDGGTGECSFEKSWTDGQTRRSLFYLVRGDRAGAISTIRAKLVNPETGPDGRMAEPVLHDVQAILGRLGWQDFDALLPAIASLKDVRQEALGASMSFIREPSSAASFNFILSLATPDAMQARTKAYFTESNWFPVVREETRADMPGSWPWLADQANR